MIPRGSSIVQKRKGATWLVAPFLIHVVIQERTLSS